MKRIIALSIVAASLAATSAFSQGWLQLTSTRSQVYDGFTTSGVSTAAAGTEYVALYWAVSGTANPMSVISTPTTGTSLTTESYTAASAWSALTGSSFTLAFDSLNNQSVISQTGTKGSVTYNGGGGFDISGTTSGETITLMEVAWSTAYATPALAAAADAAIGWSYLSSYTLAVSAVDNTMGSPTFSNYGVFVPTVVPEPCTMALLGLGGLSLLVIRRRK